MRKHLLNTCLLLVFLQQAYSQDSVQYRVILIGDAGETSVEQKAVISDAVQKNIAGKTIALFLGDNIYPKGMELPGSESATTSQNILQSEYQGLRTAGVPVYFVPGNHDWDKSGPQGYRKMLAVNRFIRQQND